MYVAVKGGEAAIANAHALLADRRRGDRSVPALRLDQIVEQLGLAVDRTMGEGSLYDKELAALALLHGNRWAPAPLTTPQREGQALNMAAEAVIHGDAQAEPTTAASRS